MNRKVKRGVVIIVIVGSTSVVAACAGGGGTSYEATISQETTYGALPLPDDRAEVLFDGKSWD